MTKSELLEELERMAQREARYRALLDDSSDPIFSFNHEGEYLYVNKQFAAGIDGGYSPEDIIGKTIWDFFPKEGADRRFAIVKWVFENKAAKNIEVRIPRADGDTYHLTTVKPILDGDGKVDYVICISKDITERKLMEDELKRAAEYDSLTKVPNRQLFNERFKYAIKQADRHKNRLALIFMDLDRFKPVNDNHGHSAGDLLLKAVVVRIQENIRESDSIGRIGGDEFLILLSNIDKVENGLEIAEKVRLALNEPFEIEGYPTMNISSSMGIAVYPDHACGHDQLIKLADDAMYVAKEDGRNRVRLAR